MLCHGLDGWRRRQGGGRGGAVVRLWPSARLPALRLAVRRRPDLAAASVPAMAVAACAWRPGLAAAAARQGNRNPLWHRAGDGGTADLSADRMDQCGRSDPLRLALSGGKLS